MLTFQGNPQNPSEDASLVALNSASDGFHSALRDLDRMATRTQDTVLVFYVKSGQSDSSGILENQVRVTRENQD